MLQLKTRQIFNLCQYIPILALLLVGASCNTGKYLNEGESFVNKNKIKFETKEKIEKKRTLSYELSALYKQRPNERVLRLFKTRLWFYYKTNQPEDTTKIDRWIQRVVAEPPVIYDSLLAKETARSMEFFLQHKGYYNAKVTFEEKRKKKKRNALSTIIYTVNPFHLYTIDSVFFASKDTAIQQILHETAGDTYLKRGDPVSIDLYNQEVERITKTLKNLGYAYFDRRLVDQLKGDSSENKVNLYVNVLLPPDGQQHQEFRVGKITVYDGYEPKYALMEFKDSLFGGVHFMVNDSNTIVKPQTILSSIYLKEGELYREDNFAKTNRQLRTLEIYKFVSIRTDRDSLDDEKLNFTIKLTPRDKIAISAEIELNNSNYSSGNQNTLIGTSLSLGFKNRNFIKTAGVFSVQLHGGLEFDFGNTNDILFSVDAQAAANWQIPKFLEFPKTLGLMNRLKLLPDKFYLGMKEKAQSRITSSYSRLLLFNFYSYHSFNATFSYDYKPTPSKRFIVNQMGINYLFPRAQENFRNILDNNPFLSKTFVEQLFTGFIIRDFSYLYTGKSDIYGHAWGFWSNVEISGLEVFLGNKAFNAFAAEPDTFQLFRSVEFSQYLRLESSLNRIRHINKQQSFAWRIGASIAVPFGFSSDIGVPYVKQFYAGGPNSIRAWRIRELGPGQFVDSLTIRNPTNLPFYQAGDFKLEFSLEYRFNIFWRFKGAVFVDGGNIWTLKEDPDRLGSQLLWKAKPSGINGEVIGDNFLKQIAMGTGLGLRGDFTYFIIRFDLGIKMRNPYPDENGNHWVFDEWKHISLRNGINYNLAIGYPF